MKDKPVSFLQNQDLGRLNTLPLTYDIYEKPVGDKAKWGYLAHVTEEWRQKIMSAGYGEMQAHIEHIKSG